MVYHSKQWYTMVQCDRTMVHRVLPWYITNVPRYILVLPWCKHGSKNLYHGTFWNTRVYLYHSISIYNHVEQFTCTMVYYGIPSYIFIPQWYKYLIPWYDTVYHSTTLCNYGISMVQISYSMVCYSL